MFTKAIIRSPAPNFSEGLTTSDLGAPNYQLALAQHQAYCVALEQCGLTLTRLEPDANFPDSVFVEDTAVLTKRCAVLARPGAPSRAGEVASIQSVLSNLFPYLHMIEPPGTLDGGDICQAGDHFFIGISRRTNEAGAQQLAQLLATFGYSSTLVDVMRSVPPAVAGGSLRRLPGTGDAVRSVPRAVTSRSVRGFTNNPSEAVDLIGSADILHLKSGIAYLGDNRLVITEALSSRQEFHGFELVTLSADEAYAANCLRVNDYVLIAAGYPAFAAKLRELGYKTIVLDMHEFQRMDGGLSCLSLRF